MKMGSKKLMDFCNEDHRTVVIWSDLNEALYLLQLLAESQHHYR